MYGRLPILKMLAATVALTAAISAVMLSINWDGQEASTAAPKIDDLLNVMIVISSFVFSLVMVALFYALWKFKVKPGDESDGEPIHGNTRLEIAWTLIPTIIVLFGGGYSWKVLDEIEKPAKDPLTVEVFSQQYAWSFGYPGKGGVWSEGEFHVPVNRQVQFKMHAQDVIHSFWVPEWRIKKDNVPGITTTAIVTPGQGRDLPAGLHRALWLRPRLDARQSGRRVPGEVPEMGRRTEAEGPAAADGVGYPGHADQPGTAERGRGIMEEN